MKTFLTSEGSSYINDIGFDIDLAQKSARALYLRVIFRSSDIHYGLSSWDAYALYDKWENYLAKQNENAPSGAKTALQTCSLWPRVFTEVVLVRGILTGLAISCSVALIALVVVVGNLVTAFVSVVVICIDVVIVLGHEHCLPTLAPTNFQSL